MGDLASNKRCVRVGRILLIRLMGGKCEECGTDTDLEFHHTQVRTWIARKKSRWQRLALYRREYAAGVLRLLCSDCNKVAGQPAREE